MSGHGKIDWKDFATWLVVGCIVIVAGLNMVGGYDLLGGADGGVKAKAISAGGLLLALLGPILGMRGAQMLGCRVSLERVFAFALIGVAVVCFGLSQFLAYRAVGVAFADGALKRETAGTSVEQIRREIAKIGITRPIAAIKVDLDLELRKTSKAYPKGDGPVATRLGGELAVAERKLELERKLEAAAQGGRLVQVGAENMVLSKVGLTPEESMLLGVLLFCVLIDFIAVFGFALLEVARHGIGAGGPGGGGGRRDPLDRHYAEFDRFRALPAPRDREQRIGMHRVAAPDLVWPGPDLVWPGNGSGGSDGDRHVSSPSHASSPVTINIGGGGEVDVAKPRAAGAGSPASAAAGAPQGGRDRQARRDLPALPADAPPVDRSAVPADLDDADRPHTDVLLAFRAACVIDTPGGLVSIVNLYRRYEAWAGERAVAEPAFAQLFPKVTGVRLADVGGFLHAHDVALRAGAALKVA